jgi:ubiquinone/menaquinone biosynthesis C-methylase UbiE
LLAALQTTPASASAHAEKLGLDARATERVLEVLLALGLAAKTGDQYAASPALVDWVESSPGGALLSVGLWNHTSEFLRTGAPFVRMDASAELREEGYRNVVSRLGKMFEPIAREVAAQVKGKPRRILDLGCGSGVWSLAIAESHPEAHVTGLDLPRVLDAFRARASALGLTNRIATIEGDVHLVDIPAQAFDLVIIANVLRIETPERARSIVARAANALSPDGTLLVVDALAEGVPERQRALAVYALHLSMRTVQGRVHSVPDIERWLAECGLVDSTQLRLVSPGPVGALVARRATSTAV